MATYQVNEIFSSIQGEGWNTGRLTTFVRLQGCTVGCPWCDTKYTWKAGGQKMELSEIVDEVLRYANQWVVITGGEPTIYNLDPLIASIRKLGFSSQLETSGQNPLHELQPDWVTWSPKKQLDYKLAMPNQCVDEIKFVVDGELRLGDIQDVIEKMGGRKCIISMMPEGTPPDHHSALKTIGMMRELAGAGVVPQHLLIFSDRVQTRIGVR